MALKRRPRALSSQFQPCQWCLPFDTACQLWYTEPPSACVAGLDLWQYNARTHRIWRCLWKNAGTGGTAGHAGV